MTQLSYDKNYTSEDVYYMNLAIAEAKKGSFTTKPNPAVGCVIVKNNLIIGIGFHPKAGMPHAEVYALRDAESKGIDVSGATAYVTLEPCSHTGRTPPCAEALVKANLARVVVATLDANPLVSGNGVKRLIQAGILVTVGVCEDEAKALNKGFLTAMATKKPYVRLKMAMSLDGKIAISNGESKWITGVEAREDVQKLRAKSGAIITGSGTVIADDPALNVRSKMLGIAADEIIQPKIVVVDRSCKLDYCDDYQVFKDKNTLLWRDDLETLLDVLASQHQCHDVLVESGSVLAGAFIEKGLVDELIIYQAPCILGSNAKTAFEFTLETLASQKKFNLVEYKKIGNDLKLAFQKI